MSGGFWRVVVALVIMVHGIGHVLFLAPCLGITQWGQSAHSWLLTKTLGDVATRVIGSLLWLVVIAGFVTAGIGLLGQYAWWRTLADWESPLAPVWLAGYGSYQLVIVVVLAVVVGVLSLLQTMRT